jgi:hypothetical protein
MDLMGIIFAALGLLFGVWIVATLARYFQFRRIAADSLLSWDTGRPWFFGLCLGIGFFMIVLTVVSAVLLNRPAIHVVAQALMAIFYTVVFPLGFRIRKGFYETGIWSDRGFVPYHDIRWIGWRDKPEIMLAMRMEGGLFRPSDTFLRVPGVHYGEARRILADRMKDKTLQIAQSVLGLEPAEEARPDER